MQNNANKNRSANNRADGRYSSAQQRPAPRRPVQDPGQHQGNNQAYRQSPVRVDRRPRRCPLPNTNGYVFSFGEDSSNEQRYTPAPDYRQYEQAPPVMNTPQGTSQQFWPQVQQTQIPYQPPQVSWPQSWPQVQQPAMESQLPRTEMLSQTQVQQPGATIQQSAQIQTTAKTKKAAGPSVAKIIRDSILVVGMTVLFALCSTVMLSSGIKRAEAPADQRSFFEDLNAEILTFKSDSLSSIFSIPKVYILPWGEQPAPVANPDGFGEETTADGIRMLTYKDETISVRYWVERISHSNVHFADIEVAHPTQLRTAYAGGEFGSSQKYMPQVIAQQVNAVIAVNGDYCGYRTGGIIVRQNTLYRNTSRGWDTLLIDSNGDFHIMEDKDIHPSGIMDEYEIVNSLAFGPSLVVDGEINILNTASGSGNTWNFEYSPRTAVGQIDRLRYLFCCVEGRSSASVGVGIPELAKIMLNKGCVQAYTLDGGQSTTMIFNGKAMNAPLWGSQRVVTDIIYCATAIPNKEGGTASE